MGDHNMKPGPSSSRHSGLQTTTETPQQFRDSGNNSATGSSGATPKLATGRRMHGPQVSLDALQERAAHLHRDMRATLEAVKKGQLEDVGEIKSMLQNFDLAGQVLDEDLEEYEQELKYLKRENKSLYKAVLREREKQGRRRNANSSDVPSGDPESRDGRLRSWDCDNVKKRLFASSDFGSPAPDETYEEATHFRELRSLLASLLDASPTRAPSGNDSDNTDFIGLPCATFYKAKSHHATKETADRLLEKIASGNVSDIGEIDDEDDIPQEDVPRENRDMPSSSKGEDGDDRSPLKEIHLEDNVPKNFQWKKKVYVPPSDTDFSGHNECPPEADVTCTPYMYFSRYVPESTFKVIAENTNQHSVKTTLHNMNTTANELRKQFGMHILMGVIHLPRVRLYWNPVMKVSLIRETMTEKCFFKLRNNLHIVAEDSGFDSENRLWKVGPFLELVRKRCLD
ncbi:hypothetical protein HPB50_025223 [Hyalomma asiaticum]|uniref:Uncharacterized protein n=1 Tax=Hyalomma asiaticum TaxID=266040 RepID=A0ACB7TM15_HYAAI|nr:hypothetical protein HPB50_025223 [Hyalomma asiaticum]